ncbi:ROK family protein [Opitutaceae bacterium]
MKVLGIDIGGSSVKGAIVDTATGRLLTPRHRIATPAVLNPKAEAKVIRELVQHFDWMGPIGCGFPGVVHGGTIKFLGNLHKDFVGCDVGKLFGRATGCPVSVVNDADAAGLAEVRFGAGRGVRGTVLMLTFGTGVGSALFTDGRLCGNTEFGQLPLRGKPAERRISAAAKERLDLSFKEWAGRVTEYLLEVEGLLWPELIIAGGGISADHRKWFKHLKIRSRIVPAKFLNEAGIVGAALHAAR